MIKMDDEAYDMIKNFVDNNEKVDSVYRGICPEEGSEMYYMITPDPKFDSDLTESIAELEIMIYQETGEFISIMRWPISKEKVKDYDFINDCIYSKELS